MVTIKKKKTRKERRKEIQETDELLQQGAAVFGFVETHWQRIAVVVVAGLLITGVHAAWRAVQNGKELDAAAALFAAEKDYPVSDFGTTVLNDADVDASLAALDKVAEEHKGSQAATLAQLDAAVLLMEAGRTEDALPRFDAVAKSDGFLESRGHAGAAAVLEALGKTDEAIERMKKARSSAKGQHARLLDLEVGRLLEQSGATADAIELYKKFVEKNEDNTLKETAEQRLQRLQGTKAEDGAADSQD